MYDAKEYFDLVTLWIKGHPPINFEILIKRKRLELLQARDESQHEGILNQKVTIIIKTFRSVKHKSMIWVPVFKRCQYGFMLNGKKGGMVVCKD